MDSIYNLLLDQANRSIEKARAELLRPEEDVVPFVVCNNAGNALRWILGALLDNNQINYHRNSSLYDLITLCKTHIEGFNKFDFGEFSCAAINNNANNYCLDVKKVSACLDVAVKLKSFIADTIMLDPENNVDN